jgi:CheY-like chemotaxis protein
MRLVGKKILIIDDDPELRTLLRKVVENAGSTVMEAGGVKEALKVVEAGLPDLITLDLSMPENDGFDFLKFRQMNRYLRTIPVLVLSGANKNKIIDKAMAMGADQFLEKPFKAYLVLQKLRYLFFSADHFVYRIPEDTDNVAKVRMNGLVIGHSEAQLKISSAVRFFRGKPITLEVLEYIKAGGAPLAARVDNKVIDIEEGQYRQVVSLMGVSQEEKERLYQWRKHL